MKQVWNHYSGHISFRSCQVLFRTSPNDTKTPWICVVGRVYLVYAAHLKNGYLLAFILHQFLRADRAGIELGLKSQKAGMVKRPFFSKKCYYWLRSDRTASLLVKWGLIWKYEAWRPTWYQILKPLISCQAWLGSRRGITHPTPHIICL